jgi:hypothetical protein
MWGKCGGRLRPALNVEHGDCGAPNIPDLDVLARPYEIQNFPMPLPIKLWSVFRYSLKHHCLILNPSSEVNSSIVALRSQEATHGGSAGG